MKGLEFGGHIRRDMAGIALSVPIASYHHPDYLTWLWHIDFFRYRRGSGFKHHWLKITRLPGHQSRIIIDLFKLGSLQFVHQQVQP